MKELVTYFGSTIKRRFGGKAEQSFVPEARENLPHSLTRFQQKSHQSIALETVHTFAFGSETIGRNVGPQFSQETAARQSELCRRLDKFAVERFIGSNFTQMMLDRSVHQLYFYVNLINI